MLVPLDLDSAVPWASAVVELWHGRLLVALEQAPAVHAAPLPRVVRRDLRAEIDWRFGGTFSAVMLAFFFLGLAADIRRAVEIGRSGPGQQALAVWASVLELNVVILQALSRLRLKADSQQVTRGAAYISNAAGKDVRRVGAPAEFISHTSLKRYGRRCQPELDPFQAPLICHE